MNKKLLLFAVLSLIVMSASAQLKRSVAAHAPTRPQAQLVMPEAVMERAEMRQPGTPVVKPPMRTDNVDVWYRRPAGAFASTFVVQNGANAGLYYSPFIFGKPYSEYTFKGFASGVSDAATYGWEVQYLDQSSGDSPWDYVYGKDLTWEWTYETPEVPHFHVTDGNDSWEWHIKGTTNGSEHKGYLLFVPSIKYLFEDQDILMSSKTFCYGGRYGDQDYLMSYYFGAEPYGSNQNGWWLGKNSSHADGIAQAFEKPEHPYLLNQVVMYCYDLDVSAPVEMTCKIYKLESIPEYNDNGSVILPEVPGELICYGRATVTPETYDNTGGLVFFTLYGEESGLEYYATPTIDDAILVVIDGYNDPAMANLTDFSALASTDIHADEGFGELAYIKYGFPDENGNLNYCWTGLNNFFTSGEIKTGLSIFLNIENPLIIFNYPNEDGQYTFPAEGGLMEKDMGDGVITRSIEFFSTEPSDDGYWYVWETHSNDYSIPEWLHITLTDDMDNYEFTGLVNAEVIADPLPEGVDYREAVIRFEIDGDYLDYKFMQRAGSSSSEIHYYIVGHEPFGDWNPAGGVEMTENADGSYSYTATINGSVWFVFSTGLDSDWNVFNSQYRYGPIGGVDQTVEAGTWYSTQRQYDGNGAYNFIGNGSEYVFTLNPYTNKFKIDIKDNKTDCPVITTSEGVNRVKVTATGNGHICLYLDGVLSAEGENTAEYIIPYDTYSKRILVSATAQESGKEVSDYAYLSVFVPVLSVPDFATDGVTYDEVNGFTIRNVWIQDRAHTPQDWSNQPYCNTSARTAVMHDGFIYIARSNAQTVTVGDNTLTQSVIYKVDASNGHLVKTLPLTLNGEIYGGATLSANSVGVDNFGHLFIAPYSNTATQLVYLVDKETGEMTLIGCLDKGDVMNRCDYIDVMGDLLREKAECNIMTVGASSEYIYRWHADQGGDFVGGFEDAPCLAIHDFYPLTVTNWGYSPMVRMCKVNDGFSGELFYVDGYTTSPIRYDVTGTMKDNFGGVTPDCLPMDNGANGICEFTLGGRHFIAFVAAQYTGYDDVSMQTRACQVYICELGDGKSMSGMQRYWMIPDALGTTSDGGTRIECINVEYGTNDEGKEEVTLFIYKCYNGMGVYKITAGDPPVTPQTDTPTITTEMSDDAVVVTATGNGVVKLYKEGVEVENPYTIERNNVNRQFTFTATAHESGKLVSDYAYLLVSVPSLGVPEGYQGGGTEYFYMDDINVTAYRGKTVTVDMKAHFEAYVDAWMVDLGSGNADDFIANQLPGGLTVESAAGGSDLTLTYTTATGEESQTTAWLNMNNDKTRFLVINSVVNYWDPDGDGVYESQGVVKWGPGEYNQMWTLTFNIPEDFAGGDIVIRTEPSSGSDANPEVNLTERVPAYYLCHFTVDEEYQKTAAPIFNAWMDYMTGTYYVDIYPGEDNCDIYYRYYEYDNNITTDWALYDGQLAFSELGRYRIEAYAVAPGKQPSDPVAYEFYNTGPVYTDMPTITAEETDDAVIVTATGDGTVILYKDGVQVQNPCVIPKQEETVTYTFTATAQEDGFHVSQEATLVVTVPGYGSGITIYVKANRAPHLFSWVETTPGSWTYPLGDWPGSVITNVITVNRVQYYTYTFDPYPSVNIIFNNGNGGYGNQTGDFVNITEDAFFVYNGGGLAYGVIPPTVYGNPTGEYAFYVNTDHWSHVNAVLDGVEYPMTLVGTDGAGFEVYKWEQNMITPPSRITFNDGAGNQVVDAYGNVYSSNYVKGGYYIYTFFAEKMYASLDMPTIITYEGDDQRPVVEDCAIQLKSSNEVWNGYNDVEFRITGTYFNPSARQGRVLYSVDGGDWVEFTSLLNSEQTFDENVTLSFNPDATRHTIRLAAQDLSGAYSTIVTVLEVADASTLECRNLPELYYTGQPLTFDPAIYDPYNNMLLTINEDYTISFSDNVNVGPAKLQVQAIYPAIIGETTFTFTILPHPISGEAYTVGEPFYYTGSAITPTVVVIDDLLGELTPGEDYTVTYIDNVEIGQAYAIVEGIGRCTGEITVPFEILDPPMNERDWNIIKMFYNQYQNNQFVWNVTDPVSAKYNPGLIEENQRVIGIELSDKGLEGSFPTMLLSLDELLTLDLSYNNLSGDAASDMVQYDAAEGITATGLQSLLINNNEFTGNVGTMAALFGNLENLNVSANHFDKVYPMVNPGVNLSLSEQLLDMDADITPGIESLITSIPTICLYDHAAQTFLTSLSAQLTDQAQSPVWNMDLSFDNGAFNMYTSSPYRGLNGQILDGYTWLNSSWTNEQLLKLKFIFAPGDANINGPVDITDLQAMVNYIFGEYNRPFNYTAANLNNDNTVNVQDVVGEANLLLSMDLTKSMPNLRQAPAMESLPVEASLYWSDGVLYLHTTVPVAALDILNDVNGDIKWNVADHGMVVKTTRSAQGEHTVIYSLGDAVIPPGVTAIATTTGHGTVVAAKLADTEADLVRVRLNDGFTNLSGIPTDGSVQCRLDGNTLIINSGNTLTDVNIGVYTIDGKVVADKHLSHLDSGQSRINLSNMADDNGYFIIVVRNGRQVIATQKLTKIR